jgi:hypothetical protein
MQFSLVEIAAVVIYSLLLGFIFYAAINITMAILSLWKNRQRGN